MSTKTLLTDANEYRYNQVRKCQSELKTFIDRYQSKLKKYHRRVVVLDVLVYALSALVVSAGVVLSVITPVTTAAAATLCVSSSTIIAGVFSIIAKTISSCANTKLHDYTTALSAATTAYKKLSSLISSSLDVRSSSGGSISDSEFKLMSDTYMTF